MQQKCHTGKAPKPTTPTHKYSAGYIEVAFYRTTQNSQLKTKNSRKPSTMNHQPLRLPPPQSIGDKKALVGHQRFDVFPYHGVFSPYTRPQRGHAKQRCSCPPFKEPHISSTLKGCNSKTVGNAHRRKPSIKQHPEGVQQQCPTGNPPKTTPINL